MQTLIVKINPKNPEIEKIKPLASLIKNGDLVAFPTETVYGIGANALDKEAVKKIFKAKKRPEDNPLILHISEIKDAKKLVRKFPKSAQLLASKFWPGPLTIILKKSKIVPKEVTCGLDTVAIRMPDNKIALNLIKLAKCPISAPSANRSGKPSPTIAKHVIEDLFGKIGAIIDGGKTNIGIESTVIDLSKKNPKILRPGMISKKEIEKIIGKIDDLKKTKKIISPGIKYTHYTPKAKVILIDSENYKKIILKELKNKKLPVILSTKKSNTYPAKTIYIGARPKTVAKNIFSLYRKLDKENFSHIIIEPIKKTDTWEGVRNRIIKSAKKIIT